MADNIHVLGVQYVVSRHKWQAMHANVYMGIFNKRKDALACMFCKDFMDILQTPWTPRTFHDEDGSSHMSRQDSGAGI